MFIQSISQSLISRSCWSIFDLHHIWLVLCFLSLSQLFWPCAIRPFLVFPLHTADVWSVLQMVVQCWGSLEKEEKMTDAERKTARWKKVQVRSFMLDRLKASTGTWAIVSYRLTSSMSWGSELCIILFNKYDVKIIEFSFLSSVSNCKRVCLVLGFRKVGIGVKWNNLWYNKWEPHHRASLSLSSE